MKLDLYIRLRYKMEQSKWWRIFHSFRVIQAENITSMQNAYVTKPREAFRDCQHRTVPDLNPVLNELNFPSHPEKQYLVL